MTMEETFDDWRLTDCPRDAIQGLPEFVPTEMKVSYLSSLMKVGFDVLDAGSFVSPKAIPQMADTAQVLAALPESDTRVLAIVANLRGAQDAIDHGRPDLLGFPLAFDRLANANTSVFNANTSVFVSEVSCSLSSYSLSIKSVTNLFKP